jgi:hypothetical protein
VAARRHDGDLGPRNYFDERIVRSNDDLDRHLQGVKKSAQPCPISLRLAERLRESRACAQRQ